MGRLLDRLIHTGALRYWRMAARAAAHSPLPLLRQQRGAARRLRSHLDQLIHIADDRLALPLIGSETFARPHGTDWAWRPDLWRAPLPRAGVSSVPSKTQLGEEVQMFHDCAITELTLRQLRNSREEDLAPYGLRLDVFKFDGSFLSLVIDLPEAATRGLTRDHLIRLDCIVETEQPIEIYARLNVRHGPNTEQLVRALPQGDSRAMVEYDLAYSRLNEKRISKAWMDLIFEAPDMNQVILRDLTFARVRRANL